MRIAPRTKSRKKSASDRRIRWGCDIHPPDSAMAHARGELLPCRNAVARLPGVPRFEMAERAPSSRGRLSGEDAAIASKIRRDRPRPDCLQNELLNRGRFGIMRGTGGLQDRE